jgi:hypothetical protein
MASDGTILYAYLDVSYHAKRGQCRRAAGALRRARGLHAEGRNQADDLQVALRKAERAMARCAR